MSVSRIRALSIQWHITTRCGNRCRHCYMYDEATYEGEAENEMDLPGLLHLLDGFAAFEDQWQARISRFAVSGGDPLLHPDWEPLMRELTARGKTCAMMGNPETLTPHNIRVLGELSLSNFQMSLDGLEETHDHFRGAGSFQRTVEGLRKLKAGGVRPQVMFTLYPENKDQLIPLLDFVATKTPAEVFCFDIGTCAGSAGSLERGLDGDDVKELLTALLAQKERLAKEGNPIRIKEKNNLLKLIRFEQSTFYPFSSDEVSVVDGCLAGWICVPVLSDGTVLACRRFPLKVGKMPEQSFEEVFLGSETLKRFRRSQFFAECGTCDFYQHCRGCPAVADGLTGDPFAPNPLCFRHSLSRPVPAEAAMPKTAGLETTYEEEHDFVASHFRSAFLNRSGELLGQESVRRALLWLSQSGEHRLAFVADPDGCLAQQGLELTGLQRLFVAHFVEVYPPDRPESASLYGRLFRAQLKS